MSADRVILEVALELLTKLRETRRVPARLLGVTLSQLAISGTGEGPRSPAGGSGEVQLGLFDEVRTGDATPATAEVETPRDRSLARAVDQLRERYGPKVVLPGRIVGR